MKKNADGPLATGGIVSVTLAAVIVKTTLLLPVLPAWSCELMVIL